MVLLLAAGTRHGGHVVLGHNVPEKTELTEHLIAPLHLQRQPRSRLEESGFALDTLLRDTGQAKRQPTRLAGECALEGALVRVEVLELEETELQGGKDDRHQGAF